MKSTFRTFVAILAAGSFFCAPVMGQQNPQTFSNFIANAPTATTPFGASDVMPVIQGGTTHKVPVGGNGGAVMLPDASNANTPTARDNIAANVNFLSWRTPIDFTAKCDVKSLPQGGATWSAGGTAFTPNNSITPAASDINKKLVVYGAGAGGSTYVGTITGVSGGAWTVSPSLTQASGLSYVYGVPIQTAQSGAGSYAPGDTITLTGGTTTGGSQAVLTVKWTKVASATIAAGGATTLGNGIYPVTGTTGTGHLFLGTATVAGGTVTAISITDAGNYITNPSNLAAEPIQTVSGTLLTGTTVTVKMGVAEALITSRGGYSSVPSNPVAQGSTSGSGTGAAFTVTFANNGAGGNIGAYGAFYYGTDDGTPLVNAAAWATTNHGHVKFAPGQKCGTSQTIQSTGNYGVFVGEGPGEYWFTNNSGISPLTPAIYWMGAIDQPIIQHKTPDGSYKIIGNGIENMSLICGMQAGYGIQVLTENNFRAHHLYIEQCTKAAIQLNTNTNALAPTDTQGADLQYLQLNQEGTNGHMLWLTADTSVGTGNVSGSTFNYIRGAAGNDTAYQYDWADSIACHNCGGFLNYTFWGALFAIELTGVNTSSISYDNKFYDWNMSTSSGTQPSIMCRGTTTWGANHFTTKNEFYSTSDPNIVAYEEPGAECLLQNAYTEKSKTLVNTLITGLPLGGSLYNARDILNNTVSTFYSRGDISGFGPGAWDLMYNGAFDLDMGWKYVNDGPIMGWRFEIDGTAKMLSAPSGTAGNAATMSMVSTYTAGGGLQIGGPIGGDKGAGALNAVKLYYNGTDLGATVNTNLVDIGGVSSSVMNPNANPTWALGNGDALMGGNGAQLLGWNLYFGSGAYHYLNNGGGFYIRQNGAITDLEFGSAPSGLAGGVAATTQQMDIDAANGGVTIGFGDGSGKGYGTLNIGTGGVYDNGVAPVGAASTGYVRNGAMPLTGTTGSIGGGAVNAGACTSGTVAIGSSTTAMAVTATPATYPGDGFNWMGYVSVAGTVTVKVCNFTSGALTPTASAYNVRVIQ